MASERITEELVRGHFKADPLFTIVKLEEQRSTNKRVIDLLEFDSKSGKGRGMPEFLISFPSQNGNYLIVIECKGEIKYHESKNLDKPKDYAVDGVLHYGKELSKDFEVICIAVSGQNTTEMLVSSYKIAKGESKVNKLNSNELNSINDYIKLFNNEHFEHNLKHIDIVQKAIYLNNLFQDFSITENGRNTIVSAILLSLMDNSFRKNYSNTEQSIYLAEDIIKAVDRVLTNRKVKNKAEMIGEYNKILNEPIFKDEVIKVKKRDVNTIEEAKEVIIYIHKNIYPLVTMEDAGFDVLGKFYTEFIRYAGSSQSQGLVLTPQHITELFCDLADITENSIVYDPCCGSGGFLISAMKTMVEKAKNDTQRENIRNSQLIGVERRPDMFTYACSNMLFRGDGKSNIYCGDCFNLETEITNSHKINAVFLNPPYDVGNVGQMQFIEHALNSINQQGIVVGIVQMSCAIRNEKELVAMKKKFLERHTLKAVISMPDELFNPAASVPTCIMVWEANKPNNGKETWFGYLKDDGFEKIKLKGRIDAKKRWIDFKTKFLTAYNNQKEIAGLSVKVAINENDEWCAEAYMETDFSLLNNNDFQKTITNFISYKMKYEFLDIAIKPVLDKRIELNTEKWRLFSMNELFELKKGERLTQPERLKKEENLPLITATSVNNGVADYISLQDFIETKKIFESKITIDMFFNVFFHSYQYFSDDNVHTLMPIHDAMNDKYVSLFITTLYNKLSYRYAYGRQFRLNRSRFEKIKLPVTNNNTIDFEFMKNYIQTLKYSNAI